jgi:hypothetical protein
MATLSEAERLMEELRIASYEPAKAELAEVQEFAKAQVGDPPLLCVSRSYPHPDVNHCSIIFESPMCMS